jgi:uncharacterized membrane protein YdjX (TVP38/TMEM64 family)
MVKKKLFNNAPHVLSIVAVLFVLVYFEEYKVLVREWSMMHSMAIFIAVFLLTFIQPMFFTWIGWGFNVFAGVVLGSYVGFLCAWTGWITGTMLLHWFYNKDGYSFAIPRENGDQIKDVLNTRWGVVVALCLIPIIPIDYFTRKIIMSRTMSFVPFLMAIVIGSSVSRFAAVCFSSVRLSNFFWPSLWISQDCIGYMVYTIYFVIGIVVIWYTWEDFKKIRNLL